MTIPKTPCPVGGLVPWTNGLWPIASHKPHPVLGWLYVIHEKRKDAGLIIWANVCQEEIVQAMEAVAHFKVGATVELGPFQRRRILGRKWDFAKGGFKYLIDGNRPGTTFTLEEQALIERIREATERAA